MWRQNEFDRLTLPEIADRMLSAFDDAGDPTFARLRPGRSEDQIRTVLAKIVDHPHDDLVWWFTFQDGYPPPPALSGRSLGACDLPLGLSDAIWYWRRNRWRYWEARREDGSPAFPHYRLTFVPTLMGASISCDPDVLRGAFIEVQSLGVDRYLPSLSHAMWLWTAEREERLWYHEPGPDGTLQQVVDHDELTAWRAEHFVIEHEIADPTKVHPIDIA